jgi:putative phosphoesterase
MIIGIISDTHNDMEMTRRAVDIFRERGVDMVIHAGDITSPKMLQLFSGLDARFVLGNEDLDVDFLNEEAARLGFGPIGTVCRLEAGGKRIIVFHGNDVPLFREAVASRSYDYIIKGHTHFFENYISNRVRVINPGALYRSDDYSVAILDTG